METENETRTVLMLTTDARVVREDFGVKDDRGRVIGGLAWTCEKAFGPGPVAAGWSPNTARIEPGLYYYYEPHATRNGKTFGALQQAQRFATAEERDAAVAKYFQNARKRAIKAAARKYGSAAPR